MNKRQRRKRRLGEFREYGFALRFSTPPAWTDEEHDAFHEACIAHVESLELALGGGTATRWDVFVTASAPRRSATSEQRGALLAWLAAHPGVTALAAGPLEDAWHQRLPVRR